MILSQLLVLVQFQNIRYIISLKTTITEYSKMPCMQQTSYEKDHRKLSDTYISPQPFDVGTTFPNYSTSMLNITETNKH